MLFGVLGLAQVFLDHALLLHAFAPLLLLAILVPEAVEQDILDFAARIVLPNHVQVLLRLVPRHSFDVVVGQDLDYRLERARVLFGRKTVEERPEDARKNNGLNTHQTTIIYAILHETHEGAI